MRGVDFGTSAKGVVLIFGSRFGNSCLIRLMAPQVFTPSEQSALKLGARLSSQMKRTFPFEYLVSANNPYAINRAIFLYL